jgi:hypothetical protein
MMPTLQLLGQSLAGVLLIVLGVSFGYKFFQASMFGKVTYWAGLEKVHWLFVPVTVFLTPVFVHTPAKENNLIKTRTAGWVHLFWGPIFFLTSLMLMVSGADLLKLPGTQAMNWLLTGGRSDIPPAITYQPPPPGALKLGEYKFPFLKRVRRTVFKLITADVFLDEKKKANPFDDSKKIKLWEEDEDDRREDELDRIKAEQQRAAQEQAAHPTPTPAPTPGRKK